MQQMLPKLVIASSNKGKIREFEQLLGKRFQIIPLSETAFNGEIEENGTSFFENALIKARAVTELLGTCALADDSGLCVEALGGAPGIYSARYAGEHATAGENNALLLKNMQGKPNRNAKFVASIVLMFADGTYAAGYGETSGKILTEPDGENGFGYDPLFYSDELKKSFGRADENEKNAISHRRRALANLSEQLNNKNF